MRLAATDFGMGRTLKQTNLRWQTGASVIAMDRDGRPRLPSADETLLLPGDTLVATGTAEAVRAWLAFGPNPPLSNQ